MLTQLYKYTKNFILYTFKRVNFMDMNLSQFKKLCVKKMHSDGEWRLLHHWTERTRSPPVGQGSGLSAWTGPGLSFSCAPTSRRLGLSPVGYCSSPGALQPWSLRPGHGSWGKYAPEKGPWFSLGGSSYKSCLTQRFKGMTSKLLSYIQILHLTGGRDPWKNRHSLMIEHSGFNVWEWTFGNLCFWSGS